MLWTESVSLMWSITILIIFSRHSTFWLQSILLDTLPSLWLIHHRIAFYALQTEDLHTANICHDRLCCTFLDAVKPSHVQFSTQDAKGTYLKFQVNHPKNKLHQWQMMRNIRCDLFQSHRYITVLHPLCINLFSKLQIPILSLMDERWAFYISCTPSNRSNIILTKDDQSKTRELLIPEK